MFNILMVPVAILLILLYYIYLSRVKNEHSPPGPKGRFLVGVLLELNLDSMYKKLHEWSIKYGDVFQFNLMGMTFVSINSADVLRDTFSKEPNASITAARARTYFGEILLDNYSDIGFASPSKKWKKRRKLIHQLLHAYGEGLQNIERIIQQNLRLLKEELVVLDGKDEDPSNLIAEFILNTVEILMIGQSFGKSGDLQPLIQKVVSLNNKLANPGWDFLYLTFPFLRHLPLPKSREMDEFQSLKQQLLDVLNKYTETSENGMDEGVGIYINMKRTLTDNKLLEDPWFTDVNMINLIYNLFAAAYLTTRGTLLSAVQLLAKRPFLQQRLQQEIDSKIGHDRQPNLSDREKCPLTEAVILETLRYISHVPYSIIHTTTEQCIINGYRIDKDTAIIPNLWNIHHNIKHWSDPFDFRPERFLDKTGNLLPSTSPERKRILAFGLGKRSCIGEVFAKSRIFLFLATLMQTTTIHEPNSEKLPDLIPTDMVPGITLQPQPYKVKLVLR